jgi:hypothetical protein
MFDLQEFFFFAADLSGIIAGILIEVHDELIYINV